MADAVTLHLGDCLEVLPTLEPGYSACFCDPPYGLGFMGKAWDHGVPSADVWRLVYDLLAPGAVLLAFGGTRTWHRLAVAIEDAGFEVFDTLMWLYGGGFPKSHDISKAIDREAGAERHVATWQGYGTALKPAWEPIVAARKPREATYAQTAVEHGAGALWIDGARIGIEGGDATVRFRTPGSGLAGVHVYSGGWSGDYLGPALRHPDSARHDARGRWPANLLLDEDSAAMLDAQSGVSRSVGKSDLSPYNGPNGYGTGDCDGWKGNWHKRGASHTDTGGASRFFYCAKASRAERGGGKHHPTVKPLAICEYLARLILPPEKYRDTARLLVPYAGSGSEMVGAIQAGWRNVTGIEWEGEYVEIAERRIAEARMQLPLPMEVAS